MKMETAKEKASLYRRPLNDKKFLHTAVKSRKSHKNSLVWGFPVS
jgi:hypothetical protein